MEISSSQNYQKLDDQKPVEGFKNDAYANASFLSKITFNWAYQIVKLANQTMLKKDHLGKLEGENKSSYITQLLHESWFGKKYESLEKMAMFRCILNANRALFYETLIFYFLITIFQIIEILLLREYIHLYENPINNQNYHFAIAILFVIIKLISMFLFRRGEFLSKLLASKPIIQLNSLIFNKVLKESPSNSKHKYSQGEMINLITSDAAKVQLVLNMLPNIIFIPLKILTFVVIIFYTFGMSFIYGFVFMILIMFGNVFLQRYRRTVEKKYSQEKDKRMKITTEILNNLKFIKLFSWETQFSQKLENQRNLELVQLRERWFLTILAQVLIHVSPIVITIISVGAYSFSVDVLVLSKMFFLLAIFNSLFDPLRLIPLFLSFFTDCLASLERIEKYMKQDDINEKHVSYNDFSSTCRGEAIQIKNSTFSWGKDSEEKSKKSEVKVAQDNSKFRKVLKNINLTVKKGSLVFVIGEVGAGKSSLLQAILNNLMIVDGETEQPNININGSISYVSQTSWIRNETVKNNILFFKEFDEKKYQNTLELCELKQDLLTLDGGDLTEIGEKGVNLSGGQKARVSIARAVYSESDIYLFDDPISALDSHVGEKIIKNCILGHLKDRTRILVTHAIQYLHFADKVVVMKEGEIFWEGIFEDLKDQSFYHEYIKTIEKKEKKETETVDEKVKSDEGQDKKNKNQGSKINQVEKQVEGEVGKKVYTQYIKFFGGFLFMGLILLCNLTWQGLSAFSDYWLTVWVKNQTDTTVNFFLIYVMLNLFIPFLIIIRFIFISRGAVRASKQIHERMIENLIRAPINTYHDTVPKGQILNKLSKDLNDVDVSIVLDISNTYITGSKILGSVVVCAIFMYYSLFTLPILVYVGYKLTSYYIHSSRDLTRIERISRSPILNIFSESSSGAITIRAFRYENHFQKLFLTKLEDLYRSQMFIAGVRQWFSLYIDYINIVYFSILLLFTLIFASLIDYAGIGLILTRTFSLQTSIMEFLDAMTNIENDMVSAERCLSITELPAEASLEKSGDSKLKNWPEHGKIEFENYSVKYRENTPIVLKSLNIKINPGEKIGVVGRTGCGKSTLCLCLFRILEPAEGTIKIDDCDISNIGLKLLRNKITIIPQDAVLFDGSLKYNLDPLNEHREEEIYHVLEQVGLNSLLESNEKKLNMNIQENGANLSSGERQLVSIARAILRGTKIVLMDEATSNIDFKTEELIQKAIHQNFKDSTLITIAHRIKTIINYDKILLLSKGEVIEFDTPQNLLKNQNSEFYHLYSKSV